MAIPTQRTLIALVLIFLQLGCGSALRTTKSVFQPKYQDEAGSTHVAVLSVAHWDEYKKALQPSFTFKEKDALELAAQSTQALEQKFVDTLRLAFQVAPPTSGTTETTTTTTATESEGVTTTTAEGERTETRKPGDVSEVALGDPPAREASQLPAPGSALSAELALEPMLKYQAASALYQEVQLLNRYIEDAVQRRGFTPFVVRMQVSMMPAARNLAADAYTTLSFFLGNGTPGLATSEADSDSDSDLKKTLETLERLDARLRDEPATRRQYWDACKRLQTALGADTRDPNAMPGYQELTEQSRLTELPELTTQLKQCVDTPRGAAPEDISDDDIAICRQTADATAGLLGDDGTPFVVPLLVTDNLESTVHSRTINQVRQLAFGLRLLLGGFGGQGGFSKQSEDLEQILGRDLNSLLTVARVTDNTYRVRLGAMQQIGTAGGYAMIPRTHNITFLLLVPTWATMTTVDDLEGISVVARTDMLRARGGKALPQRPHALSTDRIQHIQRRYSDCQAFSTHATRAVLGPLLREVQRNDFRTFHRELGKLTGGCSSFPAKQLWLDLAEAMVGNHYASTHFELPDQKPRLLFDDQAAVVIDDRKAAAVVTLRDGRRLDAKRLRATLDVRFKKALPPPKVPPLPPPPPPGKGAAPSPAKPSPSCRHAVAVLPLKPGDPAPPLQLAATKVEVQANGSDVTFTFPSADALGLCYNAAGSTAEVTVTCRGCNGLSTIETSKAYPVHPFLKEMDETPKKTARFSARIDTGQVVAAKGTGSLPLFAARTKDQKKFKIAFSVDGASVAATPDGTTAIDDGWELTGDGTVVLTFTNLIPQQEIVIKTWERVAAKDPTKKPTKGADGRTFTLTVVEAVGKK